MLGTWSMTSRTFSNAFSSPLWARLSSFCISSRLGRFTSVGEGSATSFPPVPAIVLVVASQQQRGARQQFRHLAQLHQRCLLGVHPPLLLPQHPALALPVPALLRVYLCGNTSQRTGAHVFLPDAAA